MLKHITLSPRSNLAFNIVGLISVPTPTHHIIIKVVLRSSSLNVIVQIKQF